MPGEEGARARPEPARPLGMACLCRAEAVAERAMRRGRGGLRFFVNSGSGRAAGSLALGLRPAPSALGRPTWGTAAPGVRLPRGRWSRRGGGGTADAPSGKSGRGGL